MKDWHALHSFWFKQPSSDPKYLDERSAVWFAKNPAFDAEIRVRFAPWLDTLTEGEKAEWKRFDSGYLTLILLYDQVPRNSFRNDPRSFAYDSRALELTVKGLGDRDRGLSHAERLFYYLPLEHSEDPAMQTKSLACYAQMAKAARGTGAEGMVKQNVEFAEKHSAIIERFGRFPHRNEILGRASTPEELAFLKEPGSSF